MTLNCIEQSLPEDYLAGHCVCVCVTERQVELRQMSTRRCLNLCLNNAESA